MSDPSEDRLHRPGMDINKAIVIEYLRLPTDEEVLNNLKKKIEANAYISGRDFEI